MRSGYKAMAWALALSACAASDAASDLAANVREPIYASLLPESDDTTVYLLPQEARTLTVRYEAAPAVPIAGKVVQFALVDSAKGASVDAQSGVTDEAGLASVVLTAGAAGEFTLRASAEGASPLDFTVVVRAAVNPALRVRVSYAGERTLSERTVTVVPAMDCASVLDQSAVGETTLRLMGDEPVIFPVLSAVRYAVAAWGRDDTGGRLARGCTERTTDISAEEVTDDVEVVLSDEPLTIAGSFSVIVDAPLQGLGDGLAAPAGDALAEVSRARGVSDERSLYIDAVERAFVAAGGQVANFAEAGALLGRQLDQAGSPRFVSSITSLVDARRARVSAAAALTFDGNTPALTLETLQVLDGTGMWSASLSTDGAALDAAFHAASAQVAVEALTLPIALDDLVRALTEDTYGAGSLAGSIAQILPCSVFAMALSGDAAFTAICSAECVHAACSTVAAELSAALEAQLGERGPSLRLEGDLASHARDTTAIADLGPSTLTARYGEGADALFSAQATVRSVSTQNTALSVRTP